MRDVRAVCLASVTVALDHPGHFRLMFRNDLVNREDARFSPTGTRLAVLLSRAVATCPKTQTGDNGLLPGCLKPRVNCGGTARARSEPHPLYR